MLIVLDAMAPLDEGDDQYAFLESALEQSLDPELDHVFVTLHKPLISSGEHGGDSFLKRSILPLVEKYEVTAVLAGHNHIYERSKPMNGVVHIVSGGGGAKPGAIEEKEEFSAVAEVIPHFVEITIEGEQAYLKAVDREGWVFDEVQLR